MKIGILGCKGTTVDLVYSLVQDGFPLELLITLDSETARRNRVANFAGTQLIEAAGSLGLSVHIVNDYSLRSSAEIAFFAKAGLDVLLVLGWERLLPGVVLEHIAEFACGMHGSSSGLPRGRGRSPLNWSLITGQSEFTTSLFRYTPRVDDGDIIGSRTFEVNEFDDIKSLHFKNQIAMREILMEQLTSILAGKVVFSPQPSDRPTYYPKRVPDDGLIDWKASSDAICRFVRAQCPPYPGAYTFLHDDRITIEEAVIFERTTTSKSAVPGTVLSVSKSLNFFTIKSGGGSVLVRKYSSRDSIHISPGVVLQSDDWNEASARFESRYDRHLAPEQMEVSRSRPFA